MSINHKLEILENIFGSYQKSNDEYLFYCKKCLHHKKKFSINIIKNVYKCWVCEFSGNSVLNLVKRYGSLEQIKQWISLSDEVDLSQEDKLNFFILNPKDEEISIDINLPNEFKSLINNRSSASLQARKYLQDRNVLNDDIIKWKIGYTSVGDYKDRVIIPSFSESGDINYFIARSYVDDYNKYKNPPFHKNFIFNHLYLDFKFPMTIVEGVFDAIVVRENCVPLLGSSLSDKSLLFQEIIKNNTTIYLALDPDAKEKEMNLMKRLLTYGIKLYKIIITPYKDVGEMSRDEFNKRKLEALLIDNEKFMLYKLLGNYNV